MDLPSEIILSARLLLAALLGSAIGFEREFRGHEAGVGTFAIVALGACAFAIMSDLAVETAGADNTRIAASVAAGIGFLGGGIILHRKGHISGLTTAAALWAVSAVGLATGFGIYVVAVVSTLLVVVILSVRHVGPIKRRLIKMNEDEPRELH